MNNTQAAIATIRRPKLLVRAARMGAADFRRDRDLRKLIGGERLPSPQNAIPALLELEETLNQNRLEGDVTYRVERHIMTLIALLAEARACPDEFRQAG